MNQPAWARAFSTVLLGGFLVCGVTAQAKEGAEQEKKQAAPVLLAFAPPHDQVLEVTYQEDQDWVYDEGMRGKLRTELLLHWRFEPAKEPGLIQAVGTFESIIYRGSGLKGGKAWEYDVSWNRKDGYLKGKDSEVVTRWVGGEIKEGVRFTIDKRAAANPGEC